MSERKAEQREGQKEEEGQQPVKTIFLGSAALDNYSCILFLDFHLVLKKNCLVCDGGGAGGKGLSKKEKERTHRHGQQYDYCGDGGKKTQNF